MVNNHSPCLAETNAPHSQSNPSQPSNLRSDRSARLRHAALRPLRKQTYGLERHQIKMYAFIPQSSFAILRDRFLFFSLRIDRSYYLLSPII